MSYDGGFSMDSDAAAPSDEIPDTDVDGPAAKKHGDYFVQVGEPGRAIGYYQEVLAIGRELGDEQLTAIPSAMIGMSLAVQGQWAKAGQLLVQAVPALERAGQLDFFLIGGGRDPFVLPERLRTRFRDAGLSVDAMPTGAAVRTWNILLAENRRVGAGLIVVD